MTDDKRYAVIMAGGSGERFWPLSRRSRPKQFLRLADSAKTLLEQAVEAITPLFPLDAIFIATGEHLAEATRELLPHIPAANVIAEPYQRNTAGCLVFATAHLLARFGNDAARAVVAVLASDHLIADPDRYRETLRTALAVADREEVLVTLGIAPNRPETGYGYIEVSGERLDVPAAPGDIPVYASSRFHEKPDRDAATAYLATGRHLWNSGMFFWRISSFLAELSAASPQLARAVEPIAAALRDGDDKWVRSLFRDLPAVSIDYALMEKARRVLVVKSDFGWDDIGAWDALDRTMPLDGSGNVTVGDPVLVNCSGCIVVNEPGSAKQTVAVVGMDGFVVIVSGDAVLVVPKDRTQEVRAAVAELKRRGSDRL